MENPILNVAFILATTAFFKKQFGWKQKPSLVAAFVASLVVAFVPLVTEALPNFAPYLDAVVNTVVLFLSAAGSFDLAVDVGGKIAEKAS